MPGNIRFDFKDNMDLYRQIPVDKIKNVTLDFVLNHLTFGSDYFHPVIQGRYPVTFNKNL